LIAELQAMAFDRAEPAAANQAMARARERLAAEAGSGTSYEVVLPRLGADAYLTQRVLPKLVHFLSCRGVRLPASGGVFVSLFSEEGLFFVEAGRLALRLGAARGLDAEELSRRYGPDGPGDPPLLGG
jgi:hypothetical protein